MKFNRTRTTLLIVALAMTTGAVIASAKEPVNALAIEQEVERIAKRQTLWPGFDPLAVPLAIFTGEHTWLFRHPSPPDSFSEVADVEPRVLVFEGRYPAVVANSIAEISDVVTATLIVDPDRGPSEPSGWAPIALHEAFHAYQRAEHPDWMANEAVLFVYPVENAGLLALRRQETAALRRALAAMDDDDAACWSRHALALRSERFAAMAPEFSDYEQLMELNEGLAHYIEYLAGEQLTVAIPEAGFPSTEIRSRAYASGSALAFLLDRLRPGWQEELVSDDGQHLHQMLQAAVSPEGTAPEAGCELTSENVAEIERAAQADVEHVLARRSERRRAFDSHAGWRIVIEAADGQPLQLQGFDPVNVERVEGGILHTRMLRLGNASGELGMIRGSSEIEALTEAAGEHPLFSGARRVTFAGLPEPAIEQNDRSVSMSGEDLELRFETAAANVRGTEIHVVIYPRSTQGE